MEVDAAHAGEIKPWWRWRKFDRQRELNDVSLANIRVELALIRPPIVIIWSVVILRVVIGALILVERNVSEIVFC
jgi:hypothetical protein